MRVGHRIVGLVGLLVVGLFAACSRETPANAGASTKGAANAAPTELSVFAAASLREACTEFAPIFEQQHAAKLIFNFGASNALAQQIVASGKGDVFMSADEAQMDVVEKAKLLATGSRSHLLSNQLVVIQPKPLPPGVPAITNPDLLADPAIARLSLANPEAVPAGKYAKAWLETMTLWSKVEARVVPAVDVRAALGAVESGAAQAGIVYATDAAISDKVAVALRVPLDEGPKISYAVAALAGSAHADLAGKLIEFLHGNEARAVFVRRGFIVLKP